MILRWSPFKIVSVSAVLYPRWLPLLKIEISSNGQNCSILSQNCVRQRRPVSRWLPLLKIEISSNGQNCSRFLQMELNKSSPKSICRKCPNLNYKHNDELFNIYYGIFYELWTFTDFDRLCKLEKRGEEIKKIFSSETTEPISTKLCWNDP